MAEQDVYVVLEKRWTALERLRNECDRETAQWVLDAGIAKFHQLCLREQYLLEAAKAEEQN